MGCNGYGCRPYRDYDNNRRRERDIDCGPPFGPPCHRRRYYQDDFRRHPSGGIFFGFPRFF